MFYHRDAPDSQSCISRNGAHKFANALCCCSTLNESDHLTIPSQALLRSLDTHPRSCLVLRCSNLSDRAFQHAPPCKHLHRLCGLLSAQLHQCPYVCFHVALDPHNLWYIPELQIGPQRGVEVREVEPTTHTRTNKDIYIWRHSAIE